MSKKQSRNFSAEAKTKIVIDAERRANYSTAISKI